MTDSEYIKNETEYLFDCDFFSDDFDANDSYEHYDRAQLLKEKYKWNQIFDSWFEYLKNKCETAESVINFVNLFVYYGGQDEPIKTPYDFIGYIYYKVDMEKYWEEAGETFESLSISLLEECGKINLLKDPFYTPMNDLEILKHIEKWRQSNGQH